MAQFCMLICHSIHVTISLFFFFFNDTATTEIYTLSLHDALPIWVRAGAQRTRFVPGLVHSCHKGRHICTASRSEEHTSELQSQSNLVCRLLLEKKKPPTTRYERPLPPQLNHPPSRLRHRYYRLPP